LAHQLTLNSSPLLGEGLGGRLEGGGGETAIMKEYIKPEIMIVEVKQTQMLATSNPKEEQKYLYDEETDDQW